MTAYRPTVPRSKASELVGVSVPTLRAHLASGVYDEFLDKSWAVPRLYLDTLPAFAERYARNKGKHTKT